jgi:hypothetical protein
MSNNPDHCYICLATVGELVRPCINPLCKARIHFDCVKTQYLLNNEKCGVCSSPLALKETRKLNKEKCCREYAKVFFVTLMMIMGFITIPALALGQTTANWTKCTFGSNYKGSCEGVFTFVISLFFFVPFLQFPHCRKTCGCRTPNYNIFCCYDWRSRIKYKSYFTMLILFFVSCLLIFLAHCIGYFVIKYILSKDVVFFTSETSLVGFIVYGILLVVSFIGFIGYNVYLYSMDRFSESEITYGLTEQTKLLS